MLFDVNGERIVKKELYSFVELTDLDCYNNDIKKKYHLKGFDREGNMVMSKAVDDLKRADEIIKDYEKLGYIVKRYVHIEV